MRTHVQLVASLLVGSLLAVVGCSRGDRPATDMFDGVWIGWLLPQEPNTSDLAWNVWASRGIIIMTDTQEGGDHALAKVNFTVSQQTTDADGKKGLVLQTDRGQWRIVFGKLPREHRELVSCASHKPDCPFDPFRIRDPDGAIFVLEEEKRIGYVA